MTTHRRIQMSTVQLSAEHIRKSCTQMQFDPDLIVGISNGGCALAGMVASLMGKKCICLSLEQLHQLGRLYPSSTKTLLVDEIVDKGATMKRALAALHGFTYVVTAAMHLRSASSYVPHIWAYLVEDTDWLVYPWEFT